MERSITFDDKELKAALKQYFKIKGRITFYHISSILRNGHVVDYVETEGDKK